MSLLNKAKADYFGALNIKEFQGKFKSKIKLSHSLYWYSDNIHKRKACKQHIKINHEDLNLIFELDFFTKYSLRKKWYEYSNRTKNSLISQAIKHKMVINIATLKINL